MLSSHFYVRKSYRIVCSNTFIRRASFSCRLDAVALTVSLGPSVLVEKYFDAFGNTDGTASPFKYRRNNFFPSAFDFRRCLAVLLSAVRSCTKSLGWKCKEHSFEFLDGAKSFRGLALIHLSHNCLLDNGNA